jgi:hypothetical protein
MWRARPADEQFSSVSDMIVQSKQRAERSKVEVVPTSGILFNEHVQQDDDLFLSVPGSYQFGTDKLEPTNWAFGQLCSKAGVQRPWANGKSHPMIISAALNWGMNFERGGSGQWQRKGENLKLMVRDSQIRAATGPDYGRVYDYEVGDALMNVLPNGWITANDTNGSAVYSSDRDMFIFMISEEGLTLKDNSGVIRDFQRGFMISQSEVGYKSITAKTFLYDGYCTNRTIWGINNLHQMSVRHTKNAPTRFARELMPFVQAYLQSSPADEQRVLDTANNMHLDNPDAWLRAKGFTAGAVKNIMAQAAADTGGDKPETLLEVVNAGTAYARQIPHTDNRLKFETQVSNLLKVAERKAA